jgi:hypothetical protein
MSAVIKIKNSSTASAVPTSSDLVQGELAVNVTDKRIFTENASGTVVELGTNPSILTLPDGSASAPTLTNDGDTNTGIFFPAADTIAFAEGGTETMRLDSAGNMGLGVTPSAWRSGDVALDIGSVVSLVSAQSANTRLYNNTYVASGGTNTYKTTAAASYYDQGSGVHRWFNAASGTAGNAITFTQAMTLDASGNLGLGTTSTASSLVYFTNTNAQLILGFNNTSVNYYDSDTHIWRARNSTERARIDSSGNLLVGTTSSWVTARVAISGTSSDAAATIKVGTNGNYGISLYNSSSSLAGGIIVNSGSVAYNTTSDYRLKDTIAPITGALSKVIALKPCTYKWKADGSDGEGFIAHELAEICPHAVTGEKDATQIEQYEISPAVPATFDDDGNELTPAVEAVMGEREVPVYQGIDTSFLVATLTAAIQEQQALITSLTARIEALEA